MIVLVPYGVSTFLFAIHCMENKIRHGSRPLRGIYISILFHVIQKISHFLVLVPYGVSTFLFRKWGTIGSILMCSRPLRGIYISIHLLRIPISILPHCVLVPYGVSTFLFVENTKGEIVYPILEFSSPTGYLHFYSEANK